MMMLQQPLHLKLPCPGAAPSINSGSSRRWQIQQPLSWRRRGWRTRPGSMSLGRHKYTHARSRTHCRHARDESQRDRTAAPIDTPAPPRWRCPPHHLMVRGRGASGVRVATASAVELLPVLECPAQPLLDNCSLCPAIAERRSVAIHRGNLDRLPSTPHKMAPLNN